MMVERGLIVAFSAVMIVVAVVVVDRAIQQSVDHVRVDIRTPLVRP